MNSKLAVHHRIGVGPDPRGTRGMAEAARGGSRRISQVLPARSFRTRNKFDLTDAVEGGLTPQFPSRVDRLHNDVQIVIGAQMVRFYEGRIAPAHAGEPYPSTARRLNERRRDCEALFRGRGKAGRDRKST